jgi:methylmalonyl-CoA/ethylmalonyl-CoA epimerase
MKILGLDHVAIVTDDLEKHAVILEDLFGLKEMLAQENTVSKVRLSMFSVDNTNIELVAPLSDNTAISKYLKQRGPGIHHICLLVDNIERAIKELKDKNIVLIDEQPRRSAEDSLIAFIHPDSTGGILIELKEIKP